MKYRTRMTIFAMLFLLISSIHVAAQEDVIKVVVGESRALTREYNISKVAVADPTIADVKALTERKVLILGKKEGMTSLLLFDAKGKEESLLLQVNKHVIYRPMIQMSVQVLETSITSLGTLGIEWVDKISFEEESIPALFKVGTFSRLDKITATLNLMIQEGKAQILAKPNLVALSGESANFLVGGEVPIPVPQEGGAIGIEWKEYGVTLEILPVGEEKRNIIDAYITAKVSDLDWENAVSIAGVTVPGISTRRASTKVQVEAGDTIVIAGLVKTDKEKTAKKVPLLGDIPILGYLFKSTTFSKKRTDITIFITPSFVKKEEKK